MAAFVLSAGLTAIIRRRSLARGFVAIPSTDRFHRSSVPLGGGIAVFWTMAIILAGGILAARFLIAPGYVPFLDESVTVHVEGFVTRTADLAVILGAGLVLHLVGLWDDKKRLGPFVKLILQFAVATTIAVSADVRLEFFVQNRFITTALSVLWIVLIINVFNFLDNMDGLSAGIAAISSTVLFTAAALSGQVFVGALGLVFIGSLLGFLVFNFPPARIFMGDSGSLVVGYFIAILTLRTTYYQQEHGIGAFAVFMPLVVTAVPLYDFVSVTFLRIRQGKSPFVGDTQHFSHRIKRRGLTDTQTVLTLYLATVCTGLSAVFLYQVDLAGAILIMTQTVMILAIIAILESTSGKGESNSS